jgi:hypothetical protein
VQPHLTEKEELISTDKPNQTATVIEHEAAQVPPRTTRGTNRMNLNTTEFLQKEEKL